MTMLDLKQMNTVQKNGYLFWKYWGSVYKSADWPQAMFNTQKILKPSLTLCKKSLYLLVSSSVVPVPVRPLGYISSGLNKLNSPFDE